MHPATTQCQWFGSDGSESALVAAVATVRLTTFSRHFRDVHTCFSSGCHDVPKTNTYGTTPNPYDEGASAARPVSLTSPVGGGLMTLGAILALIGHFLPFISIVAVAKKAGVTVEQMKAAGVDTETSLWAAITGDDGGGKFRIIMLILGVVLLLVGGILALVKNGKQGGSIGLGGAVVGIIGFILVMTGISGMSFGDVFGNGGIGLWLVLIGLVVGLIGAIMAFTAKTATAADYR